MTDTTDLTTSEPRSHREAALSRDLDALRRGLEAEPPLPCDDVRRRIDAIADAFLDLDDDPKTPPPSLRST